MSRKSIFEIVSEDIDYEEEVDRIDSLFSKDQIAVTFNDIAKKLTIEDYIDKSYFLSWKNRGRCLSAQEFRRKLEINDDYFKTYSCSLEVFLDYCEYVSNMILLLYCKESPTPAFPKFGIHYVFEKAQLIIENIDSCLHELNMQRVNDNVNVICRIVEINPSATMAADYLEREAARKVFEYNHYLLKGDLSKKREILKYLAGLVEPLSKQLNANGYGSIDDYTRFLLNKMNIRHNNIEGKNKNPYLDSLGEGELEKIYDKTYELILLCLNISNFIKDKKFLEGLKLSKK